MSKYSEIEIHTAKRLHDAGYKWLARTIQGNVGAFSYKPYKKDGCWLGPRQVIGKAVLISGEFTPLFQSIKWEDKEPTYIEDILNPQILDDVEKRYLSAFIKPFRDRVESILKVNFLGDTFRQRIVICIPDDTDIALPDFKSGTMYKGMEPGHSYTLKELGL